MQNDQAGHPIHADVCVVCNKPLRQSNRSAIQSDMCKMCAGEEDDVNDDIDDFK